MRDNAARETLLTQIIGLLPIVVAVCAPLIGFYTLVQVSMAETRDVMSSLSQSDVRIQTRVDDHEARLRAIESQLPAIARDISWIRQTMEKRAGLR